MDKLTNSEIYDIETTRAADAQYLAEEARDAELVRLREENGRLKAACKDGWSICEQMISGMSAQSIDWPKLQRIFDAALATAAEPVPADSSARHAQTDP